MAKQKDLGIERNRNTQNCEGKRGWRYFEAELRTADQGKNRTEGGLWKLKSESALGQQGE